MSKESEKINGDCGCENRTESESDIYSYRVFRGYYKDKFAIPLSQILLTGIIVLIIFLVSVSIDLDKTIFKMLLLTFSIVVLLLYAVYSIYKIIELEDELCIRDISDKIEEAINTKLKENYNLCGENKSIDFNYRKKEFIDECLIEFYASQEFISSVISNAIGALIIAIVVGLATNWLQIANEHYLKAYIGVYLACYVIIIVGQISLIVWNYKVHKLYGRVMKSLKLSII